MIRGDNPDNPFPSSWVYPPLSLLRDEEKTDGRNIRKTVSTIEKVLKSKDIKARVEEINVGPTVIQYVAIAEKHKLGEIKEQTKSLAKALQISSYLIRISRIPSYSTLISKKGQGEVFVGIEIANDHLIPVPLKSILSLESMYPNKNRLVIGLGLDINGNIIKFDFQQVMYTLVTGNSGSGRNSFLRMIISTLLVRTTPNEVRLLIFDPNRQLSGFKNIPYLLSPITGDSDPFFSVLLWVIDEIQRRQTLFKQVNIRAIASYNQLSGHQNLPNIVIIINNLTDLSKTDRSPYGFISKIISDGHLVGIHLIISAEAISESSLKQLPGNPVIITFRTSTAKESVTILGKSIAERLLGNGDMLIKESKEIKPKRIQSTFISPAEIELLVDFIKNNNERLNENGKGLNS